MNNEELTDVKGLAGPPPLTRTPEVQNYLEYCAGYLDAHCALLERYKAHPDIVLAVRMLMKEMCGD